MDDVWHHDRINAAQNINDNGPAGAEDERLPGIGRSLTRVQEILTRSLEDNYPLIENLEGDIEADKLDSMLLYAVASDALQAARHLDPGRHLPRLLKNRKL
jgi:hypothetical protein